MAIFKFPTEGAPTHTVTISPMEALPKDRVNDLGIAIKETPGRSTHSAKVGPTVRLIPLKIRDIPTASMEALESLIINQLQGPTNTFWFQDDLGAEFYPCLFMDRIIKFTASKYAGFWNADFTLKVEPT
jgi:hypothetical protein